MAPRLRLSLLLAMALGPAAGPAAGDDGWIELLPGTLDAWKEPHGAWRFVESIGLREGNDRQLSGQGEGGPVLLNGPIGRTVNLVSERHFGDCELSVEFLVPKGSNSGVKLHGHYEIQISDGWGRGEPTPESVGPGYYPPGGIYPRGALLPRYHHLDKGHLPRLNASRPPGEWQSLEMTFRAPRFDSEGRKVENARFDRVKLNGQVIHEGREVLHPTGNAWQDREMAEGPLLLQGDHGPVAFRNLRVRPLGGPRAD